MGSHQEAVEDFRELGPHLDRFKWEQRASILGEWATEELLVDNIEEAIKLNGKAFEIYRDADDRKAQSRSLAQAAHLYENLGQRQRAEQVARQAVEVLGSDPDGSNLAEALEANAYLQMMAGNIATTSKLVEQTLEVAGADIDERIIIRLSTTGESSQTLPTTPMAGRASTRRESGLKRPGSGTKRAGRS